MDKLVLILSASLGSIAVGYVVQIVFRRRGSVSADLILEISKYLKLLAFFVINPVAVVATFWNMSLGAVQMITYPLLGVFSVIVGGVAALVIIRALKLPPGRAASVFTSGMFTNLLTFGGLVGYVFFSEPGYMLAQLYIMLVSPVYYLIGYPISNNISKGKSRIFRLDLRLLRSNPLLVVPPLAIATGLILSGFHVVRPDFFDPLVAVLIPTVSATLGLAIGLSLRLARVGDYWKEIGLVVLIKFAIVPAVMIPLGMLFGLHTAGDGLPFKMLVVLSVMPVAFNALVPPAMFGFDLDLANSAWIVTTASLVVVVPLLYIVLM